MTELLGGELYVSCSVVLPAACHLRRAMETTEDDPAYLVRFKHAITTDLDNRLQSCNISWLKMSSALDPRFKQLKCLPKSEREDIWAMLQHAVSRAELEAVGQSTSTSVHLQMMSR